VENLQREDLNPLEQAQGYRRLIEEYGWTQEKVAQKVGKERPTVANILRLLKLPEPIKQGLRRGEINMGHARALVSVENEQDALALFQRTIREGLNVRKLEKIISRLGKTIDRKRPLIIKSPYISELEDRLRKLYATKVNIAVKSKGGVIEISYYSEEDLERIMEMLQKVNEEEWKIVDRE
jgi:ParB family chromosome partitioning protein